MSDSPPPLSAAPDSGEAPLLPTDLSAEAAAPVVPRQPPAGRKFPCKKCGARLDFDPSSRALKCPYCGFEEVIEPTSKEVVEQNWDAYWQQQSSGETLLEDHSSEVACTTCGAVILLDDKVVTDKCPYCASHLENHPERAQTMITPGGILPFALDKRQAIEAFNRWIETRWFAPGALKRFSHLGQLAGIYLPYWTYDSMTYTRYTGERGDNYTVTETYTATETYTETNAQGQSVTRTRPVTKTRQVTRIRWSYASGQVNQFFDDVLVCASRSLPENLVRELEPWDMQSLEDFRPEFLSGYQTERYAVGLRDGFTTAQGIMDASIRQLCRQHIGGDHQRLNSVNTQHVGITFKHILFPVWIAAFRFKDKPFRILVNARTGEVVGTRPYSFAKIALLILTILAAALLIWGGTVMLNQRSSGSRPPRRAPMTVPAPDPPAAPVPPRNLPAEKEVRFERPENRMRRALAAAPLELVNNAPFAITTDPR